MSRDKAIEYFNDNAEALTAQYNSLDRAMVHADLIHHLPEGRQLRMLDIGAGSGADANMFAGMGHEVVAAEPAKNLRDIANKTFKNKNIKWTSDVLPELEEVTALVETYDVVYSVGVLQYLDQEDRSKALNKMVSLLSENGLLSIKYPTPPSREYQFAVPSSEISAFVCAFNEKSKNGMRLELLEQKDVKDNSGRKALDGSDLYFYTTVLKLFKVQVK